MLKKIVCLALSLCLLLCVSGAFASARIPENRGVVTDDANVLSAEISAAVNEASTTMEKSAKVKPYTVFVHFLDGEDAQKYADAMFQAWTLPDNAILFVGAAGEDSCAVSIGTGAAALLGKGNVENLSLDSGLQTALNERRYDDAVALYLNALCELCNRQTGSSIQLSSVLKPAEKVVSTAGKVKQSDSNFISTMWNGLLQNTEKTQQNYANYEKKQEKSSGLNFGEWILIALVVLFIVRRIKKQEPGKEHRRGCSVFGWIIGIIGILFVIKKILL